MLSRAEGEENEKQETPCRVQKCGELRNWPFITSPFPGAFVSVQGRRILDIILIVHEFIDSRGKEDKPGAR